MILITTPTGKTGSLITEKIIKLGLPVRVFARRPEKLSKIVQDKADIIQGSLLDQNALTLA